MRHVDDTFGCVLLSVTESLMNGGHKCFGEHWHLEKHRVAVDPEQGAKKINQSVDFEFHLRLKSTCPPPRLSWCGPPVIITLTARYCIHA